MTLVCKRTAPWSSNEHSSRSTCQACLSRLMRNCKGCMSLHRSQGVEQSFYACRQVLGEASARSELKKGTAKEHELGREPKG